LVNVVGAYAERFVARDRTPADDVLAAWSAGREPLLAAATLVATPIHALTTARPTAPVPTDAPATAEAPAAAEAPTTPHTVPA
jgi:hypothetical protein